MWPQGPSDTEIPRTMKTYSTGKDVMETLFRRVWVYRVLLDTDIGAMCEESSLLQIRLYVSYTLLSRKIEGNTKPYIKGQQT